MGRFRAAFMAGIFVPTFLLVGLTSCRQEGKSGVQEELFDSYEGQQGVIAFNLPPGLFAMIIGREEPGLKELTRGLEKIRIILIDRGAGKDPEADFIKKLGTLGFEDLLLVNNDESRIHVKLFQPQEIIREVMILVSSDDTFMGISLVGEISEEQLKELARHIRVEDFT